MRDRNEEKKREREKRKQGNREGKK